MSRFTLEELREIMRTSAGVDEGVDLDSDIGDLEFDELGYDSLAVLEFASIVQRRYGVPIPDDIVTESGTPSKAVHFINTQIEKAGV
ncbi:MULTISPECIES: acyl carrier protein [Actinoalloteichus]|uniref:Acyl carrier protein n=1 Tax=Actinoalloteichus fjordicus TaxID=1612552 RepID=A0AAC9LAY8_9PSEU|nr:MULTISPECIES: acyl carrier protein [Actinoalloteichus]APU14262.1 acyl carrier protein [Actinoalloteichus fjordicus]APU20232.1 acyl carrier protein [Actinoalloteichus sp. GBA129-24]